jgi:D-alanyl-lipoteichoic acid acyltransferase DltB (MBOAT superfamily)
VSFLSPAFAVFFAVVVLLRAAAPRKLRPPLLLAASLFFYGSFGLPFLGLLAVQIAVVYGAAVMFDRAGRERKRLWAAAAALVLGPLIVIKYLPFLAQSATSILQALGAGKPLPIPRLVLPLGISFYTLKSLSYLIDVYRGKMKAVRNPIPLGLAVSFFPQILAGPIDRPFDFLVRLRTAAPVTPADALDGSRRIVWGLFQKIVIADQLARYVAPVFDRPQDQAGLGIILGIFFYSFQIYCDFSGYSDMAIGMSGLLGFRAPENFRTPYFSRSLSEFWTRWHITLSAWLRDYLFMPVSSALSRRIRNDRFGLWRSDYVIYAGGAAAAMLICGLWHGAGWTFVLWGGLHAAVLIVSRITRKGRMRLLRRIGLGKNNVVVDVGRRLMTFILVSLAWVPFRSPSLGRAGEILGRISFNRPTHGIGQIRFYLFLTALFIVLEILMKQGKATGGFAPIQRIPAVFQLAFCALLLCLTIILGAAGSAEFLYFKF